MEALTITPPEALDDAQAKVPEIKIPDELERETDEVIVLSLLQKYLRDQRRLPKWYSDTKENDTEHSYAVSMYATYYKNLFYPDDPDLNDKAIKNDAEIHDWPEILAGDTVTLGMSEEEYKAKQEYEEAAVIALVDFLHLKGLDEYADRIEIYEEQKTKAARFVKAVDKLMPTILDISGDGISAMTEHGVRSVEELRRSHECDRERFALRFGKEFPELLEEYDRLGELWIRRFEATVNLGHYSI